MNELRCYTFTLFQLSSIQQGIQAGHAAVELVISHDQNEWVREWAEDWKTLVCLNGGDLNELSELRKFFCRHDNPLPWTGFYESEESLGGILTSIAIILPERIFANAKLLRTGELMPYIDPPGEQFTPFEWELMLKIASKKMAQ